jgi:hypothetical protein
MAIQIVGCASKKIPTTYLGLPLSFRKLTVGILLPWIQQIANKLLGWKADPLNMSRRITLVKVVLSAIPVYLLIKLNVPKWGINAIDKIRRNFLWKGQRGG